MDTPAGRVTIAKEQTKCGATLENRPNEVISGKWRLGAKLPVPDAGTLLSWEVRS